MKVFILTVFVLSVILDLGLAMKCPKATCDPDKEKICSHTPPAPMPPKCPPKGWTPPGPGCPMENCVPKTTKNMKGDMDCSTICPTVCPPNHQQCAGGHEPNTGCPKPATCLAMPQCGPHPECPRPEFDNYGCAVQPKCSTEQTLCPGPVSMPTPDSTHHCMAKGSCLDTLSSMHKDKNGNACHQHCPVFCDENQKLCPGTFDSDGCIGTDSCVPMTGTCPAAMYTSRGCLVHMPPTVVPPGQKVCASGVDDFGCHLGFFLNPAEACCPDPKLPPSA